MTSHTLQSNLPPNMGLACQLCNGNYTRSPGMNGCFTKCLSIAHVLSTCKFHNLGLNRFSNWAIFTCNTPGRMWIIPLEHVKLLEWGHACGGTSVAVLYAYGATGRYCFQPSCFFKIGFLVVAVAAVEASQAFHCPVDDRVWCSFSSP